MAQSFLRYSYHIREPKQPKTLIQRPKLANTNATLIATTMAAVRHLFGRCGLIEHPPINDLIADDDPQSPPSTSLTSSTLSCLVPNKKYTPQDTAVQKELQHVPRLLAQIAFSRDEETKQTIQRRTESLKQLHDLTKRGKEANRIPLLQYEVIDVLSRLLLQTPFSEESTIDASTIEIDEDRRYALWTLNNLSIPYPNKKVMVSHLLLMQALHEGIRVREEKNIHPCAYLCIICLMNLTYLAGGITEVVEYRDAYSTEAATVTTKTITKGSTDWQNEILNKPNSLLRCLEQIMIINAPFLSTVTSVQGEAIRWSCGLLRNMTYHAGPNNGSSSNVKNTKSNPNPNGIRGEIDPAIIEAICTTLTRTKIPQQIIKFVKDSHHPVEKWTKDSLEDICLGILCQLVQWPDCRRSLKEVGAAESLEGVEG